MHSSLLTSSMRHGTARCQHRNSPLYLIRAGLSVIQRPRFDLDFASNPASLVNARAECWYGGVPGAQPRRIFPRGLELGDVRWRGDGLLLPWHNWDFLFGNPPWENLGPFLELVAAFAERKRREATRPWALQLLLPLRSHRSYWRWMYTADAWCLLKPVAYDGFTDQIPTPCVWGYWGSDLPRFHQEFHGEQGVVLTRFPQDVNLSPMPRNTVTPSLHDRVHDTERFMLEAFLAKATVDEVEAIFRNLDRCTLQDLFEFIDESMSMSYLCESKVREAFSKMVGGIQVHDLKKDTAKKKGGVTKRKGRNDPTAATRAAAAPKKVDYKGRPKKKKRAAAKKTTASPPKATAAKKKAPKGNVVRSHPSAANRAKAAKAAEPRARAAKMESGATIKTKLSKPEALRNAIVTEIVEGRANPFTCLEVATAMKVSRSTALRALTSLVSGGVIIEKGEGRSKTYLWSDAPDAKKAAA